MKKNFNHPRFFLNYIRRTIFLLILIILPLMAMGQNYSISGYVFDENKNAMSFATTVLLNPKDSTMKYFGVSDKDGYFNIKNISAGNYLLQTSYVGYRTLYRNITIPSGDNGDIGTIVMEQLQVEIGEVKVIGERVPIRIKRDTIEYNAKAFKTQPDAVVEDLLKKLPGIEIDRSGNIKALGKDVNKILVDGKEFFGKDPKVATKNLPAASLDKVQVFDKRSDESEFTGIDDGTRDKTVNLVLNENYKKGLFGNLTAGYGTGNHYLGNGKLYRFTDKTQLAALGMMNNVNQTGFSINDLINFSGGLSGSLGANINSGFPVNTGQPVAGYSTSGAGGVNLSWSKSSQNRIYASYLTSGSERKLADIIKTRNFTEINSFCQEEILNQVKRDTSHRINFGIREKINKSQNIIVDGGLSVTSGSNPQNGSSDSFLNNELINRITRNSKDINERFTGNLSGSFTNIFNQGKTVLKFTGSGSFSGNRSGIQFENRTDFFDPAQTMIIRQFQNNKLSDRSFSAGVIFTQKLGTGLYIEPGIKYGQFKEKLDRRQGLPLENDLLIDSLTSSSNKNYSWLRPEMTLRRNGEKSQAFLSLALEKGIFSTSLNGVVPDKSRYLYFLPSASWGYEYRSGRRVSILYRTRVITPSASQLNPVVNTINPVSLFYGNPDLKPEMTHNINLNWIIFDQFSFTSFFANISGTYTLDKINYSRSVNELLIQTLTLENVKNDIYLQGNISFSTPVRMLGIKVGINISEDYNKGLNYVDGKENINTNLGHRLSITFDNRDKSKLDISTGFTLQVSDSRLSLQKDLNNKYYNYSWFGDISYNPDKHFNFTLKSDITKYTARSFDKSQLVPFIGMQIDYNFLKSKRAVLTLQVFDLLNRNKSINRISQLNFMRETHSDIIGRYFMLSFKFRLNRFGDDDRDQLIKTTGMR